MKPHEFDEASPGESLIDTVERAASLFDGAALSYGHGTTNAFDEAAWLVLHALQLRPDTDLNLATNLSAEQQWARALPLLQQRINTRKPAAYLTQTAWLQGVAFHADERAIVPRSFIAELLADGSIDPWLGEHTQRALDLCTGNGSLAVLAAMAYPDIGLDACDLSTEALAVAAINVAKHGLQSRIKLLQGDGLQACVSQVAAHGKYDLILCNPPYVNAQSMAALPAEYLAEPQMALASGTDGMDFCRSMFAALPNFLAEHGVLVLEIGNERVNFEAAFPQFEPHWLPTSAGDTQVLLLTAEQLALQ